MKAIFVFLISQTTNPAPRTTASPVGFVVSRTGRVLISPTRKMNPASRLGASKCSLHREVLLTTGQASRPQKAQERSRRFLAVDLPAFPP